MEGSIVMVRQCNWQPSVQLVHNVGISLHWPLKPQILSEEGWPVVVMACPSPSLSLFLFLLVAWGTESLPP